MQYDVNSPAEYLTALEKDWRREALLGLRELILKHGPELTECIRYKMLCYDDRQGSVLALNAQKGYVSLYVGDASKVDPAGTLLKGLDCGKGCIRFKKSTQIEATGIEQFLARALDLRRQGGDTGC